MNLTVEQRILKANSDLSNHKDTMEYCGLIALGEREVRDDVPTAGTNGIDVVYGLSLIHI